MTPGTRKLGHRQNSSIWSFLAVFMGYSTRLLAQVAISAARDPPVHENWGVIKTRRFGHFWPFSWAIAHGCWLQVRFQWLVTPGKRKLRCRQNSSIWSFLAVLMGYSTRFLALVAISSARDPRHTKIGTSSKHVDLVISGRFHGI